MSQGDHKPADPPGERLEWGRVRESITSPVPDVQGVAYSASGACCFFCSLAMADPAIHWMGHGAPVQDGLGTPSHLFLHPACFLQLFVKLARDYHEIVTPGYYTRRGLASVDLIQSAEGLGRGPDE